MVGQQATLDATSGPDTDDRIDVRLRLAAQVGQCDLIVKGVVGGEARGWSRLADGTYQSDRASESPITHAALRAQVGVGGQALTFTCVPPGSGPRIGVDRDGDGFFDGDERDALTDPANPSSFPGSAAITSVRGTTLRMRSDVPPAIDPNRRSLRFTSRSRGGLPSGVVVPTAGAGDDPTLHGAVLTVYAAAGGTEKIEVVLPAHRWRAAGPAGAPTFRYRDVAGPILAVTVNANGLRIRGRGTGSYSLAAAPQDAVGVRLRLGYESELCAEMSAKRRGEPEQARFDNTARFVGAASTPPAVCPPVPE
jgi:hypothetical protein